nr:PREDICTED: uncharacterized protein LOC109031252 [Bemisia tabaci]
MFGPQISVLCGLLILFALGLIGQETSAWSISPQWCQTFCYQRDGFFSGDEGNVYPVSEGKVLKKYGIGYWCSCPSTKVFKDYLESHNFKFSEKHRNRKRLRTAYNSHRHKNLRNVTFYNGKDVLNYVKQTWRNFDLSQYKAHGTDYVPNWSDRSINHYYDEKDQKFKQLTSKHIADITGIKIYL